MILQMNLQNAPKIYTYKIINEYAHDKKAYTQGLEFIGDTLVESTGQYGESSIHKCDKAFFVGGVTRFPVGTDMVFALDAVTVDLFQAGIDVVQSDPPRRRR